MSQRQVTMMQNTLVSTSVLSTSQTAFVQGSCSVCIFSSDTSMCHNTDVDNNNPMLHVSVHLGIGLLFTRRLCTKQLQTTKPTVPDVSQCSTPFCVIKSIQILLNILARVITDRLVVSLLVHLYERDPSFHCRSHCQTML